MLSESVIFLIKFYLRVSEKKGMNRNTLHILYLLLKYSSNYRCFSFHFMVMIHFVLVYCIKSQ